MIINNELLFIHIPKTGGMSCTDYLCQQLKPPVYYYDVKASFDISSYYNAKVKKGLGHETLDEVFSDAKKIEAETGIKISQLKRIVAVIRHPYDLELSTYHFFRNGRKNHLRIFMNSPNIAQRVEMAQQSFVDFVRNSGYFRKEKQESIDGKEYRIESYFLVNGVMPDNLRILKFEELSTVFPETVDPYCIDHSLIFPHENQSGGVRSVSRGQLNEEEKSLIMQKHQWLFDEGYYEP